MSLAAALAIVATLAFSTPAEAASARIAADGDCLNMRQSPSLTAAVVTCVGDGTIVTTVPGLVTADGLDWEQIRTSTAVGWVAARYLVEVAPGTTAAPTPIPSTPALPPSTPTTPHAFDAPPVGGMTFGVAGTSSPAAVVAAQTFTVAGVTAIDPATQRFLTYIPGAPAFVNSLDETTLRPDMVIMVRRSGTLPPSDTSSVVSGSASAPTIGIASAFVTPPRGGLTLAIAGTNDMSALIKAQPFAVDVVMALDVPTQRWLTYIPGAPDWVSTLNAVTLRPTSVIFVRRSATAPDPVPPPPPVLATLKAPITYYYCSQSLGMGVGDGGGFCGTMSNGTVVHQGAASCDRAYLGQRFRVVGDPYNLVYSCSDTGGGVSAQQRDIWFATSGEAMVWWRQVAPGGVGTIEVLP